EDIKDEGSIDLHCLVLTQDNPCLSLSREVPESETRSGLRRKRRRRTGQSYGHEAESRTKPAYASQRQPPGCLLQPNLIKRYLNPQRVNPTDPSGPLGCLEIIALAKIKIENVVASTSLGEQLDLQAIALALGGAEYEPEQF